MAAYTTIDDPSAYFQVKTYTGTGSELALTNDGNSNLQPDICWIESRSSSTYNNVFTDSSRGSTVVLVTQDTDAEAAVSNSITSYNTDGFTLDDWAHVNYSSVTYVAWQWKVNGGTTASNSDGSITSTVQANTTAGMSIVTYTGLDANKTVGHGLGVAPAMVIIKARNSGSTQWIIYNKNLTSAAYYVVLEANNAEASGATQFNSTAPTSSVFSVGTSGSTGWGFRTFVAYCFAEVQGFSKFGNYKGNGDADGAFAYTGFKPEFVMVKRTDSTNNWIITDNARGINGANPRIYADIIDSEGSAADYIDHLSNGFKIRTSAASMNASGGTYIYMAFAENPFVTSTGIPTPAR